MLSQTFGVEIETSGLSRQECAEIVAGYFGTRRTYFGGMYDEWHCLDRKGRTWKFERDSSIKPTGAGVCEVVTPVLTYDDMADLQEIVRLLRRRGAKSTPALGCGVHVHVGLEGHTAQSLRHLSNLMASHEDLLVEALGVAYDRLNRYCRKTDLQFSKAVNTTKPTALSALGDLWYKFNDASYSSVEICAHEHYNRSRYHMLNLHAVWFHKTVEFRLFQFDNPTDGKQNGLHAGQLKAFVQLALALSHKAKTMSRSSAEPVCYSENPRYAMRTWLLKLGFIGDEFATAREVLTRKLSGDTSFKHGRPSRAA